MHTLRIILKCMGLYRRKNESDPLEGASFLNDQLEGHGKLTGYKLHHLNCIQARYVLTQSTVRHLLKFLDSRGVDQRRKNCLRRRMYVTVFLNRFGTFLQTQVTALKTFNTVICTLCICPKQIVNVPQFHTNYRSKA